jgi:peptidoglycan/xylan/chitin deacetylase (PgdA/CDA1 family)
LRVLTRLCWLAAITLALGAKAEFVTCPGNPHALGVSRIIEIDPTGGPRIGIYQYPTSLDLQPMEVVLTFDDGPRPKTTEEVLNALERDCVKATFFEIGRRVAAYPKLTQEVLERGHTVGSHSWSHPPNLGHLPIESAKQEIDRGFDILNEVSGARAAPFFRYPGLNDSTELNDYLAGRNDAIISCDIGTDDWMPISASSIVHRTLRRLESHGKGILLFHDSKLATARALPVLLEELERRGYHIVHIVPKPQTKPS